VALAKAGRHEVTPQGGLANHTPADVINT